ncbi:UNVERIFIED_CONTAM: hypothetical protein K2H54_033843 [Gekko kuhli]
MQITLKTLQQQTFKIDIDPEETVRPGEAEEEMVLLGLSLGFGRGRYLEAFSLEARSLAGLSSCCKLRLEVFLQRRYKLPDDVETPFSL